MSGGLVSDSNGESSGLHTRCVATPPPGPNVATTLIATALYGRYRCLTNADLQDNNGLFAARSGPPGGSASTGLLVQRSEAPDLE